MKCLFVYLQTINPYKSAKIWKNTRKDIKICLYGFVSTYKDIVAKWNDSMLYTSRLRFTAT